MIESKEGHYIHLFPNPIFFFFKISHFPVDVHKLSCPLFWPSKPCALQKQGRVVGGNHPSISLQ